MDLFIIHLIAAARPNFMKIAPLYHALKKEDWCHPVLVHTGQHYDADMSDTFFSDLGLPEPDYHLNIGSGTHAEQTGGVMVAYEKLCMTERPDWTVVAGDVNSTMACTVAAKKLLIPVAHLEAGLRSGDRTMPEEINRVVTDAIADLLLTPSPDGDENLIREGVMPDRIERVGNIMIDSFEMLRTKIEEQKAWEHFELAEGGYCVVTLHRPSNVDDVNTLGLLVETLVKVSMNLPLVFPLHPRTRKRLEEFGLLAQLEHAADVKLSQPMNYISFMGMVIGARAVITDSGGVQEETSYLGIPCLTLRANTERPVTITHGTNKLTTIVDLEEDLITAISSKPINVKPIELWDGATAERVVDSLRRHCVDMESVK